MAQGVCKIGAGLLWEETWRTKGRFEGAVLLEILEVEHAVSKLGGISRPVPSGAWPRLGCVGRKWCLPAIVVLEKSPKDPYPYSTCSEIHKSSYIPQAFFKLILPCYISVGLFVMLSL